MPVSLAIIGSAYTGEARGRAIGIWAAAGALAIAVSRPLGGWLIDTFGWRSIFFVNLPLAALALLFGSKLTADRATDRSEPLDTLGTLLAILALGLLSYGLITLGKGDHVGAIAVIAAIPIFGLFVRTETRSVAPMTPLSMFRSIDFSGANALTFFYYAGLSSAFFMLPFVLIEVHGFSATAAGAAFLPLSAFMVFGSHWTGAMVDRFGARLPLVLGSSVTVAGYVILGLSGDDPHYLTGFLPGLIVVGIGVTLSVAPLTTAVFDSAPRDRSGAASGINNAIDVTGGLVAVAALGLAFGGTSAGTIEISALANGYRLVMFAAAALAALSALTAVLTLSPRAREAVLTRN